MKNSADQLYRCPLCGFEFRKGDAPCEHGCPLGKLCRLVCCPSCHYEFPEQRRLFPWFDRLFHRRRVAPAQPETLSLCDLDEGEQAELVCLKCEHTSRHSALAVYGLVPGSRLVLQQKRPAYIIRIGETELALEPDIAREVLVKRV